MSRGRLAGWSVLIVALAVWEAWVRISGVPAYLLPAPSAVAATLTSAGSGIIGATGITLAEALGGLVLGGVFGLGLAVIITFWGHLEQGLMSLALLIKSTPIIAVAPILTIWMGFGHGPKVVVTALLTFFPVLVNSLEGFRSVDPAISDWFRSIDSSSRQYFLHARWPSARPFLFAALKVAGPLSLIGAVVAEWMGASAGLGRHMWLAYTNLNMPSLFAAVFILTLLSAGLYHLVVVAERRTVHWT